MIKKGDKVYAKSSGRMMLVTDVRLAKDYDDGDYDAVFVKPHPDGEGYSRLQPYEKRYGSCWDLKRVTKGSLQLNLF